MASEPQTPFLHDTPEERAAADLVLCAKNADALYPTWLRLARDHESEAAWLAHLAPYAVGLRRRGLAPAIVTDAPVLFRAMGMLREYYRDHVREIPQ